MNTNLPVLSSEERTSILDREIEALVSVGMKLVSRVNFIAVLDQEDDAELVEVYVDPHGRVAHI